LFLFCFSQFSTLCFSLFYAFDLFSQNHIPVVVSPQCIQQKQYFFFFFIHLVFLLMLSHLQSYHLFPTLLFNSLFVVFQFCFPSFFFFCLFLCPLLFSPSLSFLLFLFFPFFSSPLLIPFTPFFSSFSYQVMPQKFHFFRIAYFL